MSFNKILIITIIITCLIGISLSTTLYGEFCFRLFEVFEEIFSSFFNTKMCLQNPVIQLDYL